MNYNPQAVLLLLFGTSLAGVLGHPWWGLMIVSGVQMVQGIIDEFRRNW